MHINPLTSHSSIGLLMFHAISENTALNKQDIEVLKPHTLKVRKDLVIYIN